MNSESIFAATFVKGQDNNQRDEWIYPKCVEYTSKFMNSLIAEQGLIGKELKWKHPNNQTWMAIYHNEDMAIPDV